MTYPVITLDSDFDVFADVEMADTYAEGASHAADWRAEEDEDERARHLITATRILNRQSWKGEKTDPDQTLAWPRKNTGIDGVEDDVVPVDIENASIELAFALQSGSEVQNQQTTAERIRSMTAGSVSITFSWSALSTTSRFPQIVQELLRMYLAGSGSGFTGVATGVDGESSFPADLGVSGGL